MTANFELRNNQIIVIDGKEIDLQNEFDMVRFKKGESINEIEFGKINTGDGDDFNRLLFRNKKTSYRKLENWFLSEVADDAMHLKSIVFAGKDTRGINSQNNNQTIPKMNDDIVFHFKSGGALRLHCDEIELIIK